MRSERPAPRMSRATRQKAECCCQPSTRTEGSREEPWSALERPGPAALARRHQCWSRRAGGDLQGRPADPLSCRLCEARRTARDARPNRADLLAKFSRSVISKKDRSIDPIYFRTLTARANRSCHKSHKTRMGQDAGSDLCFEVSSRDRIAPDCAIRHPVWPIVALQRRVRFSARLAGFCGD